MSFKNLQWCGTLLSNSTDKDEKESGLQILGTCEKDVVFYKNTLLRMLSALSYDISNTDTNNYRLTKVWSAMSYVFNS